MKQPSWAPLAIFAVIWLALSALFEWTIVKFGFSRFPVTALMWSVGVAAMLALLLTRRPLAELGWSWGPARYHWIAWGLPLVYGLPSYLIANAMAVAQFPSPGSIRAYTEQIGFAALGPLLGYGASLALVASAGLVQSMATALGEEIGWRGFLTPRLTAMFGFVAATLVTGLVWASWHLPMLYFSDYNAGGDRVQEAACFVVMVVAISGPFAWLRLASGSLWPAAMLHASHNLFIQSVLDPLVARGDDSVTMVGEFGVVTAVLAALVSAPFWVMGVRLAQQRRRAA